MRFATIVLTTALLVVPAASVSAQSAQEVVGVVTRFFDGMRAQDTALIRSTLFDDVRLVTTATNREGKPVARAESLAGFMQAISRAPGKLDEKIFAPEVRIEDNLATVWTRYELYVNDQYSHCGIDAFQLVRTAAGWKIATIADTRRATCEKP